jgi:cellobiose-specific phosphotransferase system component IIB
MTTSLFASKMQTLAQLENRNYEINATGYGRLYEIGNDYDVILLAPQVSYLLPEVRMHLEDVIVEEIPARYFARNEYKNVLDFALTLIEEENV